MAHFLVITRPVGWDSATDDDDFDFEIVCDGKGCALYAECEEGVHLLRSDERYDHDIDNPHIEHGVPHSYLSGGGWCVPIGGCAFIQTLDFSDSHWDIASEHGLGRHEVTVEWSDWGSGCFIYEGPAPAPAEGGDSNG
ncbi:hypothetical protein D1871_11310 [Nakamurella silvestris]|nr:hypothetical protein D1871_11310 [Nakamurella silvestris]